MTARCCYNASMSKVNPNIFHAYDVRGLYPQEIDPDGAYRIGWAFGKYLKDDMKIPQPMTVAMGMDMRGSSPFLAREAIRGLNDQGIDVVDLGRVPTPALYYAVAFRDYAAGVMVTASHMTREYNGLKLCAQKAYPIAQNTGLPKIKEYALSAEEAKTASQADRGRLLSLSGVTREYVLRDLSYVDAGKIKKLKIAADPGNAMGALYLEELFKAVPCDPIKLNWDLNGNMPVHEANPLKLATLQQLQAVMENEKADFGIATDGDGDRISFLDERAQVIPSDLVAGLVAQTLLKKHPGAKIGYDLRSSRVVKEMIEEAGGVAVESRVGHSFVKALMKEQDMLFASELSGHYYLRDNFNYESPVFMAAQLLELRSELDKPFSEIWTPHRKYFHSGEINFDVADKAVVVEKLEKKYADGKIGKLDGLKVDYPDWWFNVRPSANDPVLRLNLEAKDEGMMKEKLDELTKTIQSI